MMPTHHTERIMKRMHTLTSEMSAETTPPEQSDSGGSHHSSPAAGRDPNFLMVPTPMEVGLTRLEPVPHKKVQATICVLSALIDDDFGGSVNALFRNRFLTLILDLQSFLHFSVLVYPFPLNPGST